MDNKKWERVYKVLDNAHISAIKQLAKITQSWELDAKELRANISVFKNEKWENSNSEDRNNWYENILKRLEEI